MQKKQPSPYETLGVAPSADLETIKAAYRKLAKAHHLDVGGDATLFAAITRAYDVLTDPARRKLFDEQGKIDDSPVDAKRDQAKQLLFDMLAHALMGDADPTNVNLLAQVENNIQQQIVADRKMVDNLHRAADRAARMETRFTKKKNKKDDDNVNVFVAMLQRHQQQIAEAIESYDKQIEMRAVALEICREYSYSMDGSNNFMIRFSTGSSTTGGFV